MSPLDADRMQKDALSQKPIAIPLVSSFRFVHEPVSKKLSHRFVGRKNETKELVDRLQYSEGGSFLITGYRGVGKTSFVNQVLDSLKERLPVLDVQINLARPLTSSELMHLIVRRIYERLVENGWYGRLPPELKKRIVLAYERTSANVVRKHADGWERGIEIGGNTPTAFSVPLSGKLTGKRTKSVGLETSFLAYDDKAAENDLLYISTALTAGIPSGVSGWVNWLKKRIGSSIKPIEIKIVFVFDELDKLDDTSFSRPQGEADGQANRSTPASPTEVENMLSGLKNLFTTSGICFVFVAGKDLHERWMRDVWRGDSVYESVFSYDKYLACMWGDVDALCEQLTEFAAPSEPSQERLVFSKFIHYLKYKGRGIPRRILRAFNEVVAWKDDRPCLLFENDELRRVTFFSGLNQLLERSAEKLFGRPSEDVAGSRQDRRRLGIYYVLDWILRQGKADFTVSDLLSASRQLSEKIALAEEIASGVINDMIDMLVAGEYIELVEPRLDQVAVGASAVTKDKRYRLTARRLAELSGIAVVSEAEAQSFQNMDQTRPGMPKTLNNYELHELLGEGGMGKVYRAFDNTLGIFVALKILNPSMLTVPIAQERFLREVSILKQLKHPNIVTFFDSGKAGNYIYLVMELIDGLDLSALVATNRLETGAAISIMLPIAQAIAYAHREGFVRLDLKPSNIRVSSQAHPYLMDLGIAKKAEGPGTLTVDGMVGTPLYMSPEQINGTKVDQRSDIYSFGLVLYEVLTGIRPFKGESIDAIVVQALHQPPRPLSEIRPTPRELEELVLKCLEKSPELRFQTMEEVETLLKAWLERSGFVLKTDVFSQVRARIIQTDEDKNASTLFEPELTGRNKSRTVVGDAPKGLELTPHPVGFPWLEVEMKESTPWHYPIEGEGPFGIGRDPSNQICLGGIRDVSRFHARLNRIESGFELQDLNSLSGSFVNFVRIMQPYPLSDQDQIQIGPVHMKFHLH